MLDWYEIPAHPDRADLAEEIPAALIDEELFVLALFILARSPEFNTALPDGYSEPTGKRSAENNTNSERASL
ncbi:MAG: hypothetical protein Q9P14_12425 [candidate division KSB1 bacterium]|nr:hypothetical protein [candidate division KSB1 bacterium]MDQ7063866.1 hypothetical protein [candidate division KSB1 bacterium]